MCGSEMASGMEENGYNLKLYRLSSYYNNNLGLW